MRSPLAFLAASILLLISNASLAQPVFSKTFVPDVIGPGSVSTLRFTIDNTGGGPTTGMAFTDVFPAAISVADPAAVTSTCGGTVNAGGGTISLTDGLLGAGNTCIIRVNVTASTPGVHTNTSGDLTSSAGNSGTATDDLEVNTGRPGFTKSFSPSLVFFQGRSTLTFTIDNSLNTLFVSSVSFTDNLPAGMVVASPSNVTTDCGAGTTSAAAGSSVISANFNFLGAGSTCTLSVDVLGNATGSLGNVSGELTSIPQGGFSLVSSGKAGATLTVEVAKLSLSKSFLNDPTPPGGTVQLQFTLRNLDRNFFATGLTFSDDLEGTLTGLAAVGLPLANPCGAGSTLAGTSELVLTGGNLGPESECTFSVTLQVPSDATPGQYTNTTSAPSGDVNGETEGGNPATDILFVQAVPTLTKEFTDDPAAAGGPVTLEFTVTNTSLTSVAEDVAFTDVLAFLPTPVTGSVPADPCGPGSSIVLNPGGDFQQASLVFSDDELAVNSACTFSVTLDLPLNLAPGVYENVTEEITATVNGQLATGSPAADDLTVIAAPSLTKEFLDDPVLAGNTVTLRFNLSYTDEAPGDATDISFSDDLDATLSGLEAVGLPLIDVCGTGSQIDGTMTLLLTGGTLAPGDSCEFDVTLQVPADAPAGPHTNTTSAVEATVLGTTVNASPASDDLDVAGLVMSKSFTDDPVIPGGVVNLEYTIDNVTTASDATDILFTHNLDLVVDNLAATGLPLTDPCGAGSSLTGSAGDTFLILSGGSLLAGTSCTFAVSLQVPSAAEPGDYSSATSDLQTTMNGGTIVFDGASDTLSIAADILVLTKEFTDDPVAPGETVTLRFTLSNSSPTEAVTGLTFSDNLTSALPGLVATGLPIPACGGTVSGTDTIVLAGGSLGPAASCSFDVILTVPTSVTPGSNAVNLTSSVQGEAEGLAVSGDPATDELQINTVTFSKSFVGSAEAGGTVDLNFTIQNLSSSSGISDLGFTDDLEAVIAGLVATGLPASDVCGSGSLLSGTSLLTLTGGNLLPGGSCTFGVTLDIPVDTEADDYVNVTSSLRGTGGVLIADPATAEVSVASSAGNADCEKRADYEPLNCSGSVTVTTLEELDAYVASDFGRSGSTYKNLVIAGSLDRSVLDIESPCKIDIIDGVVLSGDFVSVDGRQGVKGNGITQIDATGNACLLSELGPASLFDDSIVNARSLSVMGFTKAELRQRTQVTVDNALQVVSKTNNALIGSDSTVSAGSINVEAFKQARIELRVNVMASGAVRVESVGDTTSSHARVDKLSIVDAGSLFIRAPNFANLRPDARVAVSGDVLIESTGTGSKSIASVDARAEIDAGGMMDILSGFRVFLRGGADVSVVGNLNGNGVDNCSVSGSATVSAGSLSGNCF